LTRTTSVSSHTRRLPEKAPDPFAPVIEAKRATFARKWGVELIGANDDRLAKPIADPVPGPGRMSLAEIAAQLRTLAKLAGWKG
jgi:hypothetical protein